MEAMQIDPLITLTFSVQTNKGVYALLLGSGISSAAGIPTGWDVVCDLIQKLAVVLGEDASSGPERWFEERFGREADYAGLLRELTETPAERTQILRSYFEPTQEERDQGLKAPTKAHRAIAELMRAGYIRIVITTNFDRLLEQALKDEGMEPVVVSTVDAIKGAPPLAHTQCTIIKLHGDYLDHRLKNTEDELANYEQPMNDLLDRVLDEFGLIVCGWSAACDTALRSAIERCPNRRYPTYWAVRGTLNGHADKLIALRKGKTVDITNADDFFGGLRDNILALERFQSSDPISANVAVARAKRYLSSREHNIDFHDLMCRETERVARAIWGPDFPVQGVDSSNAVLGKRLAEYENVSSVLLPLASTAAYWSGPEHHPVIVKCLRRLAEAPDRSTGLTAFLALRRYPALLFLYAAGIGAIAADKYEFLIKLLDEQVKPERHRDAGPLISVLHQQTVMQLGDQKLIPGRERESTPLSNQMELFLRPVLNEYLPSERDWEHTFDLFEYLLGLLHCYRAEDWPSVEQAISEGKQTEGYGWGPLGRFGWRNRRNHDWLLNEMEIRNGVLPAKISRICAALLPGNNPAALHRFLLAKTSFDNFVRRATLG